jgi:hypothetical protein
MIQDDIVDDPPAAASKSGARARSALRQVRTRSRGRYATRQQLRLRQVLSSSF